MSDGAPPSNPVALTNDYVLVSRDRAPFAEAATPGAGDRVIVAMAPLKLTAGGATKELARGQFVVFKPGDSYSVPEGAAFFEVAIKPDHPPVKTPPELIPPSKNMML